MTTMSKLKRKKPAAENCSRPEQQSSIRNKNESLRRVQETHCSKTDSFGGGAVSWWERSELNDEEKIWALTLRAFCPTLQTHQEECIPQLPPLSSTLLQEAPVEKVSDWKWGSPNEDIDPPDLPGPSYVIHPPPVNDPTSRPPTVEDTGKSGTTAHTNQEAGVSLCDLPPTQHQHLKGHALLDTQSHKLGPAGNVSQCGEITDHGSAAGKMYSSLKRPPSNEAGEGIKLNPKTPVHRYGQNSSVLTGRQGQEGEREVSGTQEVAGGSGAGKSGEGGSKASGAGGSGIQLKIKSGAGGSTLGLGIKSRAGGSGSQHGTKSGAGGSGSQLGTKSGAGGSGSQLGTKSGAGGSGSQRGTKLGAGGSGLGIMSGARGSGSQLETKLGAGGSGWGLGTNSAEGGSGSQLGTKSGARGSGLELGIKSRERGCGSQLRTEPGAGGSGLQLGKNLGAGGSGSQLGTESGGSGSQLRRKSRESRLDLETKPGGEESKLRLECCPMCLLAFPAGFSQMDCDGHLAQCLSEMHEDIVW